MFDVALASAGAQVLLATSSDESFPPENIIDGKEDTFWSTTGLYPQEFVITFQSLMNINSVRISCYNVKDLYVERSVGNEPNEFEELRELKLESTDSQLQVGEFSCSSTTAQHIRFSIKSGHDHFCSVHQVHIDGNAVHS